MLSITFVSIRRGVYIAIPVSYTHLDVYKRQDNNNSHNSRMKNWATFTFTNSMKKTVTSIKVAFETNSNNINK